MTQLPASKSLAQYRQECMRMDAPLGARLAVMAEALRSLEPAYSAVVDAMVDRLQEVEVGAGAPRVGDAMPRFVLPDEKGQLVSLAALLDRSKVVIAFDRGHWCSFCRISAAALAEIDRAVAGYGGQLIVITPELPKFNRKLKAEAGAQFPILSDLDNGYALALSMAIRYPLELIQDMADSGSDIVVYQNNEGWVFPIPATFVVGQDGIVKARHVDPDYRKRMEIEDLLAGLRN